MIPFIVNLMKQTAKMFYVAQLLKMNVASAMVVIHPVLIVLVHLLEMHILRLFVWILMKMAWGILMQNMNSVLIVK